MSEILRGRLYLGSLADAVNETLLERLKITTVITCQSRFDTLSEIRPTQTGSRRRQLIVDIEDTSLEPILDHFFDIYKCVASEIGPAHMYKRNVGELRPLPPGASDNSDTAESSHKDGYPRNIIHSRTTPDGHDEDLDEHDRDDEHIKPSPVGRVFLHCRSGVSRSATMAIALAMVYFDISLLEAFEFVFSQRPMICPNTGFMKQLCEAEAKGKLLEICRKVDYEGALDMGPHSTCCSEGSSNTPDSTEFASKPHETVAKRCADTDREGFADKQVACLEVAEEKLPHLKSSSISLTKYISWYTAHGRMRPPVPHLAP